MHGGFGIHVYVVLYVCVGGLDREKQWCSGVVLVTFLLLGLYHLQKYMNKTSTIISAQQDTHDRHTPMPSPPKRP
jgi:hypothetical protein